VHLTATSYACDLGGIIALEKLGNTVGTGLPPELGILLRPTRMRENQRLVL